MKSFGINGHPGMTDSYNNSSDGIPYPDQIQYLKDFGASWYRMGFVVSPDGSMSAHRHKRMFGDSNKENEGIIHQCKEAGINVLAVLHDRLYNDKSEGNVSPLWEATNEEIYQAGFAIGSGFASRYGEHFTHYELGNEYELFRNLKVKNTIGDKAEHYISARHPEVVAWYVKGMDEGIKSIKPEAKTIYNTATYSAWFMYEKVFSIATGVDIVGAHIYNDMLQGPVASVIGDDYDFVGYLREKYSRPVWVTETGYRWSEERSSEENEEGQVDWFNKFVLNSDADAIFWHELLSNPRSKKTVDERNFGVVGFNDYEANGHGEPHVRQLGQLLKERAMEPPVVEPPVEEPPVDEPDPIEEPPVTPEPEEVTVQVTGISWSLDSGLTIKLKKSK